MIDNQLDGEWLQARPGEYFLIRIPASATNNSYSVTEIISSPGDSTPVHVHEKEDDTYSWWKARREFYMETGHSIQRLERWSASRETFRTRGVIPQEIRFGCLSPPHPEAVKRHCG
jgi:hypothetical protein